MRDAIEKAKAEDGFLEFEIEDWTAHNPDDGLWVDTWDDVNDEFTAHLKQELLKLSTQTQNNQQ